MYKIYVIKQRRGGSERVAGSETSTHYAAAAAAAFWAAYNDPRFNSDAFLLLLTRDSKQIAAHRFMSVPGDRDYVAPGEELPL
ncbi:hypothetical protein DQD89_09590 [Salmonella enterica subsp. enterica]|nr:hypothetical protein [Salmonella enterica subsp. enterica]MLP06320.1 hypothetical protein [Salmonella enterica subsp. enterica serovar Kedougou]